jgi:hypothetical protein
MFQNISDKFNFFYPTEFFGGINIQNKAWYLVFNNI